MSIEQFTVQPTSIILTAITIVVIALGVVLLAAGFSKKLTKIIATYSLKSRPTENKLVYLIVGIIVIGVGVTIYATTSLPSTITIGSEYVSFQSPPFIGAGSMTVPSDQIASAYIAQLGQGNLTMSKEFGTNAGNINIGVFTLGNGKTAHVLSTNQTSLVIELKNSEYIILGTADTDALATSFSQNVYPLTSP